MSARKTSTLPTRESINKYVGQHAADVRKAQEAHGHHDGAASVRTAEHKGHKIVVRTTYEVTVDGKPVTGHLGVTNDGQVHYHPVPNRSFASAVDLVKAIIDVYPDDFAGKKKKKPAPHGPPGHTHDG